MGLPVFSGGPTALEIGNNNNNVAGFTNFLKSIDSIPIRYRWRAAGGTQDKAQSPTPPVPHPANPMITLGLHPMLYPMQGGALGPRAHDHRSVMVGTLGLGFGNGGFGRVSL